MADVVAPTNRDGDRIGSVWNPDFTVTTPESFKLAYKQYVRTGYGAVPFDPEFGGGGFPWVTAIAMQEMLTSANMALSLCPLLTQGAIEAVSHHGSDELRNTYLPRMLTGEWPGTMNLTEPQAGSDVGAVRTKAEPSRRRLVAHQRPEDLHHLRRARPRREHRAPGAGSHARLAAGHQGDLDVPRPQVPRRRPTVRSVSATTSRACRSSTSWGSTAGPRACCRSARRRRDRLARRRRARGHAEHVHDDEHRPTVGRAAGTRRRRTGIPAGARARAWSVARGGRWGRRPASRARSSIIPTCVGC